MIVDGWITWAIQAPGVSDKIYSQPNSGLGLVGHSIVGNYQSALSRFLSEERLPNGRYTSNAAASVMFILCKNGDLIQMYPVTASTWTSGGFEANTSYWAIEAEGGPPGNPGEPFTDAQRATLIQLFEEFEQFTGRAVVRGTTFREHGELAAELGYAPTACPSHRYDWFTGMEEDDMTPDEVLALSAGQFLTLLRQAIGVDDSTFSDQESVAAIRTQLSARAKHVQENLTEHISNHATATDERVYSDIARAIGDSAKAILFAGAAIEKE